MYWQLHETQYWTRWTTALIQSGGFAVPWCMSCGDGAELSSVHLHPVSLGLTQCLPGASGGPWGRIPLAGWPESSSKARAVFTPLQAVAKVQGGNTGTVWSNFPSDAVIIILFAAFCWAIFIKHSVYRASVPSCPLPDSLFWPNATWLLSLWACSPPALPGSHFASPPKDTVQHRRCHMAAMCLHQTGLGRALCPPWSPPIPWVPAADKFRPSYRCPWGFLGPQFFSGCIPGVSASSRSYRGAVSLSEVLLVHRLKAQQEHAAFALLVQLNVTAAVFALLLPSEHFALLLPSEHPFWAKFTWDPFWSLVLVHHMWQDSKIKN